MSDSQKLYVQSLYYGACNFFLLIISGHKRTFLDIHTSSHLSGVITFVQGSLLIAA